MKGAQASSPENHGWHEKLMMAETHQMDFSIFKDCLSCVCHGAR
jgi:hypothetical protein